MLLLTRAQIEEALVRLDKALGRRGTRAELFLVGGTVMCLVLDMRRTLAARLDLIRPQAVLDVVAEFRRRVPPRDTIGPAADGV
jgi:hypothetical protein